MKKFFTFALCLLFFGVSLASVPSSSSKQNLNPNAAEIMIQLGKDGQKISLLQLSKISKDELELITGRKMNASETFAFNKAQKQMKRGINNEGVVTSKKLQKLFRAGEEGFHFGGFALGFFVGIIGVLIAYLINDDYKRNRVKWAWLGFGIYVVIAVGVILLLQ